MCCILGRRSSENMNDTFFKFQPPFPPNHFHTVRFFPLTELFHLLLYKSTQYWDYFSICHHKDIALNVLVEWIWSHGTVRCNLDFKSLEEGADIMTELSILFNNRDQCLNVIEHSHFLLSLKHNIHIVTVKYIIHMFHSCRLTTQSLLCVELPFNPQYLRIMSAKGSFRKLFSQFTDTLTQETIERMPDIFNSDAPTLTPYLATSSTSTTSMTSKIDHKAWGNVEY